MRAPFTDSLLRPPGESCRLKLEALTEELFLRLLIVMGPCLLGLLLSITPTSSPYGSFLLFLLSGAFAWYAGQRFKTTLRELRDYRLGFDGERAVGQELSQALALGCKVYHDVQFEGYNIDHVIVAPSGLYAVETKTRRKKREKNSHRVRYDGLKLIFPHGEDLCALEQALRNAKSLSTWLSSAVGESVRVEPILTFPGWLIDRQGKGKVQVLNPKEIVGFVTRKTQPELSPQLIQRIAHQLEQKNMVS